MNKIGSFCYEIRVVSNEEKENCLPFILENLAGQKKRNIDESRVFKNVTQSYLSKYYNLQEEHTSSFEFSDYSSSEEEENFRDE